MLFNDLIVNANLIKIGGLEEALQDYPDNEISDMLREDTLSMIKTDLLIETNQNVLDYDLIATNNEALLTEALRCLQRYNIMMNLLGDISGANESMISKAKKDYESLRRKFASVASSSSTKDFTVKSIYL